MMLPAGSVRTLRRLAAFLRGRAGRVVRPTRTRLRLRWRGPSRAELLGFLRAHRDQLRASPRAALVQADQVGLSDRTVWRWAHAYGVRHLSRVLDAGLDEPTLRDYLVHGQTPDDWALNQLAGQNAVPDDLHGSRRLT